MKKLLRWIRGALGIGVTWAALWMVFGVLLVIVARIVRPHDVGPGEGLSEVLPVLAIVGLLSGLGFAAFLSVAERRRKLHELSLGRVALWGLLGSAAIPLVLGTDGSMGWLTGLLGATFATGSVALARRGSGGPRELSDGDLPDAEVRKLPS
jgi:hypothetical protein